jgi:hypothetical protein
MLRKSEPERMIHHLVALDQEAQRVMAQDVGQGSYYCQLCGADCTLILGKLRFFVHAPGEWCGYREGGDDWGPGLPSCRVHKPRKYISANQAYLRFPPGTLRIDGAQLIDCYSYIKQHLREHSAWELLYTWISDTQKLEDPRRQLHVCTYVSQDVMKQLRDLQLRRFKQQHPGADKETLARSMLWSDLGSGPLENAGPFVNGQLFRGEAFFVNVPRLKKIETLT